MPRTASLVEQILEYGESDRKLRAYAYLTASFNRQSSTGRQIADAIDCLMPFVVTGIAEQAGKQIDLEVLSDFLSTNFGFNVPLYALDQILPRAQEIGALTWNPTLKIHVCNKIESVSPEGETGAEVLAEDFSVIDQALASFAIALGRHKPINSATWTDALITFLKSETEVTTSKFKTVDGAIIADSEALDNYIVARFIQEISETRPALLKPIVNIFTGVLIEDFIRTIQELGSSEDYDKVNIYYDTTILLRLLGTSGNMLHAATTEMHRSLGHLGCKTFYFEHTDNEVANILGDRRSNSESRNHYWRY